MAKKNNYVKTGMAIGAGLGMLSGLDTHGDLKDNVTNLAVGGLVGGFGGAITGYAVGKVVESLGELEKQSNKSKKKFGGGFL